MPPQPCLEQIRNLVNSLSTTDKYKGEIACFVRWTSSNNHVVQSNVRRVRNTILDEFMRSTCVTRENVDDYFKQAVKIDCSDIVVPDSAWAIHHALQWYADHVEYLGEDNVFVVAVDKRHSHVAQLLYHCNKAYLELLQTSG